MEGEPINGVEIETARPGARSETNTILLSFTPARDEADEIVGISAAAMDITELKQTVEVLRETEEHYKRTLELSEHVPFTSDRDGKLLWIGATGRLGVTADQLVGDDWRKFIHPDDLQLFDEKQAKHFATGEPIDFTARVRSADGAWRWMRSRNRARRDTKGEITGWYGLLEDIDDRKQIEEGLHEAGGKMIPASPSIP